MAGRFRMCDGNGDAIACIGVGWWVTEHIESQSLQSLQSLLPGAGATGSDSGPLTMAPHHFHNNIPSRGCEHTNGVLIVWQVGQGSVSCVGGEEGDPSVWTPTTPPT